MDAKKLNWCCRQKKGIKIIDPNDNLAKEYITSSEDTLIVLQDIKNQSNMWLATTKYYCEYFAVYALLMKLGVKCEIHDCTVELCKFLEQEKMIPNGFANVLEDDKDLRIDNQYYLKNRKVDVDLDDLRNFVFTLKQITNSLTLEQVTEFRENINELLRVD
jgi:uncharacterized protein (UPF0332 family)